MNYRILHGDCLAVMPRLDAEGVDAIVCDPPYGLKFMGKAWDRGVPGVPFWAETLRVAKPGAYLLAFGGTRTSHRLACAIEDAGWEIHDTLMWLYGSGFPKHDSKLKPGWEPIVLARKKAPRATLLNIDACRISTDEGLSGGGTPPFTFGGTNARPFHEGAAPRETGNKGLGRWPANVVLSHSEECELVGTRAVLTNRHHPAARGAGGLSTAGHTGQSELLERRPTTETVEAWSCAEECPVRLLDEQSGTLTSGANPTRRGSNKFANTYGEFVGHECTAARGVDVGGASRFYYCAKTSRAERDAGLTGARQPLLWSSGTQSPGTFQSDGTDKSARNHHPTVKPIALMRWLCRLITPRGGVILDHFAGSGSTGCAAVLEGFDFIGIEREAEFIPIAEGRIAHHAALYVPALSLGVGV